MKNKERIKELLVILDLKDKNLSIGSNAPYGHWYPDMIKIKGEHYDYYRPEFSELVHLLLVELKGE